VFVGHDSLPLFAGAVSRALVGDELSISRDETRACAKDLR
jgi:hypothetical protein